MIDDNKNQAPWWKAGVEIFTQVSTWIIVPILVALFGGKALDAHYGTAPEFFLILAGIGFLFTCVGIVKVMKSYIKKLKEIEIESSKNKPK